MAGPCTSSLVFFSVISLQMLLHFLAKAAMSLTIIRPNIDGIRKISQINLIFQIMNVAHIEEAVHCWKERWGLPPNWLHLFIYKGKGLKLGECLSCFSWRSVWAFTINASCLCSQKIAENLQFIEPQLYCCDKRNWLGHWFLSLVRCLRHCQWYEN